MQTFTDGKSEHSNIRWCIFQEFFFPYDGIITVIPIHTRRQSHSKEHSQTRTGTSISQCIVFKIGFI